MGRWAQYRKRGRSSRPSSLPPGPGPDDWIFVTNEDSPPPNYGGIATWEDGDPGFADSWQIRSRPVGTEEWTTGDTGSLADPLFAALMNVLDGDQEAEVAFVQDGLVVSEWSAIKTCSPP